MERSTAFHFSIKHRSLYLSYWRCVNNRPRNVIFHKCSRRGLPQLILITARAFYIKIQDYYSDIIINKTLITIGRWTGLYPCKDTLAGPLRHYNINLSHEPPCINCHQLRREISSFHQYSITACALPILILKGGRVITLPLRPIRENWSQIFQQLP